MKKNYIKPQCETVQMDTLAPLAGSAMERILCTWIPWKRNIHWDNDGVGGWALNGSFDYQDTFPFVRSDDAVKGGYEGEWYYTLEIIDH